MSVAITLHLVPIICFIAGVLYEKGDMLFTMILVAIALVMTCYSLQINFALVLGSLLP